MCWISMTQEPPPPRSTPWGAYRWYSSCIHISALAWQPGEIHNNVSAFALLHLLQSAVCWFGMFWWSTYAVMCTNHIDMIAHTLAFLQVWVHSHHPDFYHASSGWWPTSAWAWRDSNPEPLVWQANALTIQPCQMTTQNDNLQPKMTNPIYTTCNPLQGSVRRAVDTGIINIPILRKVYFL